MVPMIRDALEAYQDLIRVNNFRPWFAIIIVLAMIPFYLFARGFPCRRRNQPDRSNARAYATTAGRKVGS